MRDGAILVTGGAGFIGSHIVDALVREGATVNVLDDLSTGRRENLPRGARLFVGDILDEKAVDESLRGVGSVIHLAARVAIRDSLDHFSEDARTNLIGTLSLLKQCRAHKVRNFLFASSMAVYPDTGSPLPIPETSPLEPISPYGLSKLAAEKYVRLLAGKMGMRGVCLRYFNVYGPRQAYTPYVGVITIFIEKLLKGESPVIFGDGEQQRDFISVQDITRATLLALQSDLELETMNVGTGFGTSVNQVARLLIEKTDADIRPTYAPTHPGEVRHSVADISRIRGLLGFEPRDRMRDRIDDLIAWKRQATGGPLR